MNRFNEITIDGDKKEGNGLFSYDGNFLEIEFESQSEGLSYLKEMMKNKKMIANVEFSSENKEALYQGDFLIRKILHNKAELAKI